jgi:hypothetical protein
MIMPLRQVASCMQYMHPMQCVAQHVAQHAGAVRWNSHQTMATQSLRAVGYDSLVLPAMPALLWLVGWRLPV